MDDVPTPSNIDRPYINNHGHPKIYNLSSPEPGYADLHMYGNVRYHDMTVRRGEVMVVNLDFGEFKRNIRHSLEEMMNTDVYRYGSIHLGAACHSGHDHKKHA